MRITIQGPALEACDFWNTSEQVGQAQEQNAHHPSVQSPHGGD